MSTTCAGESGESETQLAYPCPICLCNEDDTGSYGMCSACGQFFCGPCSAGGVANVGTCPTCPTCRAAPNVSDEEGFGRLQKLVHDRSEGRHTGGPLTHVAVATLAQTHVLCCARCGVLASTRFRHRPSLFHATPCGLFVCGMGLCLC